MQRFFNWLSNTVQPTPKPAGQRSWQADRRTEKVFPKQKLSPVEPVVYADELTGDIESGGPGKNVFVRNRYVREDTGTHETLKIISSSVIDQEEDAGQDPYNSGRFDRSKSWASYRARK